MTSCKRRISSYGLGIVGALAGALAGILAGTLVGPIVTLLRGAGVAIVSGIT